MFKKIPFTKMMAVTLMTIAGCTDNDYSFDNIDATIGLGGDRLELPTSSTDTIRLADILDIDDGSCVMIDSDGYYLFTVKAESIDPIHPNIDIITLKEENVINRDLLLTIDSASITGGRRNVPADLSAENNIQFFNFGAEKPDEVVSLDTAYVDANYTLTVSFPKEMMEAVPIIAELTLEFPPFFIIGKVESSSDSKQSGNILKFTDVPTKENLTVSSDITAIDFNRSNSLGSIALTDDSIVANGVVHMKLSISEVEVSALTSSTETFHIGSSFAMSEITMTSAVGKFDPAIDMNRLGEITVRDVPDFLKDNGVVIDLYNPVILLTTDNDMDMRGNIDARLTAEKDGGTTSTVEIDNITIKESATTNTCICRATDGIETSLYDQVKVVPALSDILRTIPDNISFLTHATADSTYTSRLLFGHEYAIFPSYEIYAPIAFASDANIVYRDSIDSLNKDIKNLQLAQGAYLEITADIENRLPIFLSVKAEAFDINHNIMSSSDISIDVSDVIAASQDGVSPVTTPLVITVRENAEGALKRVEGICFTADGSASSQGQSVTGQTLNAERHSIIAKDVRIVLVGKVIADMN